LIDLFLLILFVSLQQKGKKKKGKQTEAKRLSTIKTTLEIYAGTP